ncbi:MULTISPECIES: transglycosylase family protein [unclassified Streptomyces]|uniref:transglycosylase family protein n=1 Tax=unclassified Streptomyces TaxID=2593676 RepID=UPI0036EC9D64
MTGSAIAIPLLGAGGASAADGNTWDQVAQCETGGSWSANDGDGHYGGLDLSQKNWEKYGGLDYATSPDLASRNQQIAVAEKVLADQGVGVWGTCGLLHGLSEDSGSADVDTGVASPSTSDSDDSDASAQPESTESAETTESSESPGSAGLSNSSGESESADATDSSGSASSSPTTGADKSAKSDNSGSTPGGAQSSASSSAAPTESDESDNSWREGGSSNLVDTGALVAPSEGTGRHRGASAEEGSYTVRTGDTLASIADSLDLDGGWRRLYTANEQVIGADPSAIEPGQTLALGSE